MFVCSLMYVIVKMLFGTPPPHVMYHDNFLASVKVIAVSSL